MGHYGLEVATGEMMFEPTVPDAASGLLVRWHGVTVTILATSSRRWRTGYPLPPVVGLLHRVHCTHLAGMIVGMTTTKIAVSLPAGLVEQAKRAVAEGRSSSVSAYVARALEEQAKLDDLASLLEEMLAETGGPLTASERKAADRALGR